ncbi:MAG: hypothetical protein AB8B99_02480 [Phormidesmis sp.]
MADQRPFYHDYTKSTQLPMSAAVSESATSSNSLLDDLLGNDPLSVGLLTVIPIGTTNNQVVGTSSHDFLQGTTDNDAIFAGGGSDAILVTSGNNLIYATDNQSRGSFERDYLNIGTGRDTIVLGDNEGSYYTADGWGDSLYIDGFNTAEDQLVLHGTSELYSIEQTEQGSWILLGDDSTTAIAFLKGIQDFDLEGGSVSFLGVPEPEPMPEPEPVEAPVEPPFTEEFYQQLGVPEFEDVIGSTAEDLLVGGMSAERLVGFGGRDYAFGGGGTDLFVLGDFGGNYYTDDGWNDSVYIDDFTVGEDQIQLNGSASDYEVKTTKTGAWISTNGDAIAFLNGVTNVDLSSFEYLSL